MSGLKSLKNRLDKLDPPVDDDWMRHTEAYHWIFEEPESEQREYLRMLMKTAAKLDCVTIPERKVEDLITHLLSTERLRGTVWERYVTDWEKPPWEQQQIIKK